MQSVEYTSPRSCVAMPAITASVISKLSHWSVPLLWTICYSMSAVVYMQWCQRDCVIKIFSTAPISLALWTRYSLFPSFNQSLACGWRCMIVSIELDTFALEIVTSVFASHSGFPFSMAINCASWYQRSQTESAICLQISILSFSRFNTCVNLLDACPSPLAAPKNISFGQWRVCSALDPSNHEQPMKFGPVIGWFMTNIQIICLPARAC